MDLAFLMETSKSLAIFLYFHFILYMGPQKYFYVLLLLYAFLCLEWLAL